MNRKMIRYILLIFIAASMAAPAGTVKAVPALDAISPYDIMNEINNIRSGTYGLAPLQTDSILMGTALATAQTMAATGSCSHIGDVRGRVMAAGYGGGVNAWATENIACGSNLTLQTLVYQMWNDEAHLIPMKNANYRHIGAGVAEVNGYYYYVVHAAYTSGSYTGSTPAATAIGGTWVPGTSIPTADQRMLPVITATPQEDGSIVHTVLQGQTLWSIAIAYGVTEAEIIALNVTKLSSSYTTVFVGETLYIKVAPTPTITPTITETPKPPTRTPRPTATASLPAPSETPLPTITPTPPPVLPSLKNLSNRWLGIGLVLICGLGLFLVALGGLKKKPY